MTARPLRVLHIIFRLAVTNAQYNEHCLPLVGERDLSICSYTTAEVTPPSEIRLFEGDGTLRGFWKALRLALHDSEYDAVHVHAPRTALLLLFMSIRLGRSLSNTVCTVHNSFSSFKLVNQLLLVPIFAAFPAIVLCSKAAAASMPRWLRSLGGKRVHVVQNGVDTDRIRRGLDNLEISESGPDFEVSWIGRLIPRKDPLCVLEAFARALPHDGRLRFIGDGSMHDRIVDAAKERGVADRVHITGLVDREDVYRHTVRADVFVSMSHSEGLPISVLEAMGCGVPVILSDIPPHREIVQGIPGIELVELGDVEGLQKELLRFCGLPPEDRRALGERCRGIVETKFSLTAMHRAYEAVYSSLGAMQERVGVQIEEEVT